jgi:hypothetical protein
VRRLLAGFVLTAVVACLAFTSSFTPAADPPDNPRVKATREKMLPAKLKLDIDKKMLRAIISDDLPAAVKEATGGLTLKIEPAPGQGVTLTSSFGPFKGEMTLEEVLNKICEDKAWGWYVNVGPATDQKNGAIFLTTNPKERGYKEGTGPSGKEVAKKDEHKDKDKAKEKPKDEPKVGDADRTAAELLTKAKVQLNLKQPEKAKATLNEIVEKYPDTKAATEAKKLLEKIGQ